MDATRHDSNGAIVIGAGIAGLLAARALADHYPQVTILDHDTLPEAIEPRKGVPQGRHAHALLGGGRQAIEALLPGISEELVRAGAVRGHGRFFSGGGFHARMDGGPAGLFVSRPLLEGTIRGRVLALGNVSIRQDCHVRGLLGGQDGPRVQGVRVLSRATGQEEALAGALVVDASGRGSKAGEWLAELGYPAPEVELCEVGMGYTTRFYRREPEHLGGDVLVNVAPLPGNPRACGMMAQEGDRWIVTVAGYFGNFPPTDEAGYLEFARQLPVSDVYETIVSATPLTEPEAFRFVANQWRRYDRLDRFPDGLLVIGDAIASFTPIYGQGMTVAALEAQALAECLAQGQQNLAKRFFRASRGIISIAWSISVGNDRNLSPDGGKRPAPERFIRWYLGKLQVAARHDPQVALAFMQVGNLMGTPQSLLRPSVAWRVLRGNLGRRESPEPSLAATEAVQPLSS